MLSGQKVIRPQKAVRIASTLKRTGKKIILAGGCFDIIHIGHIRFLEQAKKIGDCLIILLENDLKVRQLKGHQHPYFHQQERAEVLANLISVDYIILLPEVMNDGDYGEIVTRIKPDVIAMTENDSLREKKETQARKAGGKIKVIPYIQTLSSSKIAKLLGVD